MKINLFRHNEKSKSVHRIYIPDFAFYIRLSAGKKLSAEY